MSLQKTTGVEYWTQRWANHIIPFHRPSVHPYLKETEAEFTTTKKLRVFIPMCGKMREIKWFYERGHTVVGVEITRQAIDDFFKENELTATEVYCTTTKSPVFQTMDKRLSIYCCDVMDFMSSEPGKMDVVFDRATLCIMESQEHRLRYMNLMNTLLAPGYTYLLTTFKHDDESYQALPKNVSDDNVKQLFGTDTVVEKVCELREITVQGMKSPLIEVTWRVTG
ncbi:thiopurine S-methyltransferase-like isoform X2 [Rhipicephalus sanguineus]|uniref:thiopurine S-methyltransferase-like isoform X2 n=1 Tax=Rhipicephalus sanguineus TaxID=34632 RepID=UPI001894FF05|nr:thiopurine S-methyltransferase-like isoform X2 [Rhipicephalus sanguineus]